MSEIKTTKIMTDLHKTNSALGLLLNNKHHESFLVLFYSWVDRMAWLSIEGEESTGSDFKNWVNKYLLEGTTLPCTADDLWAARCGILHTGAAEARDTRKGKARSIHYFGGQIRVSSNNSHQVCVNLCELHMAALAAVGHFVEHLKNNLSELAVANTKLGIVLSRFDVHEDVQLP
ncbi:hypothetical protein ACU74D_000270 [Yersinia enterocolitica]